MKSFIRQIYIKQTTVRSIYTTSTNISIKNTHETQLSQLLYTERVVRLEQKCFIHQKPLKTKTYIFREKQKAVSLVIKRVQTIQI